jgi:kynurenine 3-monooxygenase
LSRIDLRNPGTIPLNFTRSINLAVSERGINALRNVGHATILQHVMSHTVAMRGRMIHGRLPNGELYEQSQDYDIQGRVRIRSSIQLFNHYLSRLKQWLTPIISLSMP